MIELKKIAVVGNYPPLKCGIATFTNDVYTSLRDASDATDCSVVAVSEHMRAHEYPEEVRFEIARDDPRSYERAAEYLNFSDVSVVSLQHEFGIYGGASGAHVLGMLRRLRMPIVTTLHTILHQPSSEQRRVLQELCALSSRLVVMSEHGRHMLRDVYGVSERKVDLILHGIPDVPFVDPDAHKGRFQLQGKRVLLTFGLLSPNKGIEHVIQALPEIAAQFPDVVYVVLGATHPNLVREQGEAYREGLQALAARLGVAENVRFFNQFVGIDELKQFLLAADIYVTPYLNRAQITSGTLSYAFGCGKPVVSTPYWHAEELLADDRGVLVPFADPPAIARETRALLADDTRRNAMRERAYESGRDMLWSKVAERYRATFEHARHSRVGRSLKAVPRASDGLHAELPELRIDHLRRMTDSVGMFQHARFTLPNYAEGYCLDDNARALLFTVHCDGRRVSELSALETTYASFIEHAFDSHKGRFRNFMSFERHWLEAEGSADSHGRALWALGACVQRSPRRELRSWAADLFVRALDGANDNDSPRAWAFTLLGIDHYLTRLPGDLRAARVRDALAGRLLGLYLRVSEPHWSWPENILAYDNARLSQALIVSGHGTRNSTMTAAGLESLRWLVTEQTAERGHFRPIGCHGFYSRGGSRAQFDQQPIEAQATVAACASAYMVTRERFWYAEARRAFDWFTGHNDLGVPLLDPSSGGCHDGLHVDRVNLNQGAESTLAFLLSLVEMKRLTGQLAAPVAGDSVGVEPAGVARIADSRVGTDG